MQVSEFVHTELLYNKNNKRFTSYYAVEFLKWELEHRLPLIGNVDKNIYFFCLILFCKNRMR